MKPVVLVPSHDLLPLVMAGAARAGRGPSVSVLSESPDVVAIVERGVDSEMAVLSLRDSTDATTPAFQLAAQGARLIPALVASIGVGVELACLDWLGELPPGLNVAVPSFDDDEERRRLWSSLHASGVTQRHHLLDVDGRPALDELRSQGRPAEGDQLRLLAFGAAGVLAGRMVVADRRWQRSIQA